MHAKAASRNMSPHALVLPDLGYVQGKPPRGRFSGSLHSGLGMSAQLARL